MRAGKSITQHHLRHAEPINDCNSSLKSALSAIAKCGAGKVERKF